MHFCSDELMALLALVPFLGTIIIWLRIRLARLRTIVAREKERIALDQVRTLLDSMRQTRATVTVPPIVSPPPPDGPFRESQRPPMTDDERRRHDMIYVLRATGDEVGAQALEDEAGTTAIIGVGHQE